MPDTRRGCGNNLRPASKQPSLSDFRTHVLVTSSFFFLGARAIFTERDGWWCFAGSAVLKARSGASVLLTGGRGAFRRGRSPWSPTTPPSWSPSSRVSQALQLTQGCPLLVPLNLVSASAASWRFCSKEAPRLFLSFTRSGEGLHGLVECSALIFWRRLLVWAAWPSVFDTACSERMAS